MTSFNLSEKEAICIDEEVFFGPITDKERKIREHFENASRNENKISVDSRKVVENDVSKNDSLYKSFSVDDSKYDSFDDSLNEEIDKKPPQLTKHVTLRKSFGKLKPKRHAFYDSLEDVCSLVSNFDKCSISCEVENDSNFNDKQHIIEDSLKNPPIAVANRNYSVSEQVHFDDDSLAIVELENTFDDSLEEFNVLSSIEIEEINDIENVIAENENISTKVDQNPVCISRNLFETSVQVICEKKKESDTADQEESSDDKNMLYDSLSNSDFKDILKDSLEESEKCIDNLLKHVSDVSAVNPQKPEQLNVIPRIKIEEISDLKNVIVGNQNVASKVDQSLICTSRNLFDTSVQIICEKKLKSDAADQEESFDDKNILCDSLSNSDFKDILKDSLEESEKCIDNLKPVVNVSAVSTQKSEQMSVNQDIFDTSVQIVYEKLQNLPYNENISESVTNSECKDISKDNLENFKNVNKDPVEETAIKSASEDVSHSSSINAGTSSTDGNQNALYLDFNTNRNCKENEERLHTVITEPVFPISAIDNSRVKKETFTVDSCHFKLLNDNLSVDKDLKFQLHIEVTVGDKRCEIATQDIKLLPVTLNSNTCENVSLKMVPTESDNNINKEVPDSGNSELHNKEHSINEENIVYETNSNENNSCDKFKTSNATNITHRVKTSVSQQLSDSELKFNFHENMNNGNLLQALDLHDISASFLNESIIQSKDSVIPLNLCSRGQDIQNLNTSVFKRESKENLPELLHSFEEKDCSPSKKTNYNRVNDNKTPKNLQKCPSFKETTKKTPGTKIPVRKVENFAVPVAASTKLAKQVPTALSVEKVKKYTHPHTPHSAEIGKKTPMTTPIKAPHFCKVRNTIFSKVPQIVPSKKYINVQSPVAQYIRNIHGSVKTPGVDPVLRDCMNHMHVHQQLESPPHLYQTPKGGSVKSAKRKA